MAALLLPAGCASSDDPHQGGFFGGVAGLTSGAYEKRAADRQKELTSLQEEQDYLKSRAEELTRSQSETQSQISNLEAQLGEFKRGLADLNSEVSTTRGSQRINQKARDELSRQIAQLGEQIKRINNAPSGNEEDIQKKLGELRRRYDTLNTAIVDALSK